MAAKQLRLGPFDLLKPIGRGGMGEVWRGVHRGPGKTAVAVKVLVDERARNASFQAAFRREVQAVAALDHPRVVAVYDHGEIDEEAERVSEGRVLAGTPYLVMELVTGGTLTRLIGHLDWPQIRGTLLALLDALAHSHARGVVHADLKTGNVLVADDPSQLKLTDYGLARALDHLAGDRQEKKILGTPSYMPPEQIEGRFRDHGPWTDLYALGCLCYTLVTGGPPFADKAGLAAVMAAQLSQPPPKMRTTLPVPHGLEDWARRLLEKEPSRRFQRAADAAFALRQLGVPSRPSPTARGLPPQEMDASQRSDLTIPWEIESLELSEELSEAPTLPTIQPPQPSASKGDATRVLARNPGTRDRGLGPPLPVIRVPPLPGSWRDHEETAREHLHLQGVGLGLYGLRAIPLVGREQERDRLWESLRGVRETHRARLCLLRGPSGCGKSRLAEWLCQRAHEVGGATVLRAVHSPLSGPLEGLRPMVARHLRCTGLSREEVLMRLSGQLALEDEPAPLDEAEALTELVAPATDLQRAFGVQAIHFGSPRERHVLLERLIRRLVQTRPVLLWLDDVQWGLDALGFARHLLEAQREQPCATLIVLTAREEALAERPAEWEALDDLLARPEAEEFCIDPLPAEHSRALVHELLGLDGRLAEQVQERTAGNPLFAVQLVGDWVQRGILEPGSGGFRLKEGASAELPDDLHSYWADRLKRFLRARERMDRAALELAATLGQDVLKDEWEAICALAGSAVSPSLVDALVTERLARRGEEQGWSFVHGMLRESLERRAREKGRWTAHNAVIARYLDDLDEPQNASRLGRHLVAAGQPERALTPLLVGARQRRLSGDYREAATLLDDRERAMQAGRIGAGDLRWAEGWLALSELKRVAGAWDIAKKASQRAEAAARRGRSPLLIGSALVEKARAAAHEGDLDRSSALLMEAADLIRELDDVEAQARCALATGYTLRRQGRLDAASRQFHYGLEQSQELGDPHMVANAYLGLSQVALFSDRAGKAEAYARRGLKLATGGGFRFLVTLFNNCIGEVARLRGDLQAAEQAYRGAVDGHRAIGSPDFSVPQCNLALVLVEQGSFPEARDILETCRRRFQTRRRRGMEAVVHACLLPCVATDRDWDAWDGHLDQARLLLLESGFVEVEIPRMATLGARIAAKRGQLSRARSALDLAAQQWQKLGREADAEAARQEVGRLSPGEGG